MISEYIGQENMSRFMVVEMLFGCLSCSHSVACVVSPNQASTGDFLILRCIQRSRMIAMDMESAGA